MTSDDYRHFVAIVAGENPEKQMERYDAKIKVEPYLVYRYKDADTIIRPKMLAMYENIINSGDLSADEERIMRQEYEEMKAESTEDFFDRITLELDIDEETGDAYSSKNRDGKWHYYSAGGKFSIPFMTLEGKEVNQAKKSEIDWSVMHLNGQDVYRRAWEMVMEGSEPQTETEKLIYNNMKNRTVYFQKFGTKENYVVSGTAFWGYAFLSPETGWVELEDTDDQFEWVSNFYDRFIKPLPEDTQLTIYECVR
jgi:hypothetical protein